jgi:pimeloyl-[acyl-carrier protein] methyl ester esterase
MSTIVMLHGWGIGPAAFDPLARVLASRHVVHALPLPGYEGTSAISPYDLAGLVADLAARAPRECALAGWSLGAHVALAWARARPAQVERLVVLSATPRFVRRDDWVPAVAPSVFADFTEAVRTDPQATLRRFVSLQVQGDAAARRVARTLRLALARTASTPAAALEGGLRILAETDLRGILGEVKARTLVIHGDRDRLAPAAAAAYVAHALPSASLALVPGAAHAPFVTDPESVGLRMLEFLDAR